MGRLQLLFNIGLHRKVKIVNGVVFAPEGESAAIYSSFSKSKPLTTLSSHNLD